MTVDAGQDGPAAATYTSLRAALEASLASTPRLPRDAGSVQLLLHYADLMDDAGDRLDDASESEDARDFGRMVTTIAKIGPRLEAMIDRLGMAPGARPARPGGDQHDGRTDPAAAALAAARADVDAGGTAAAGIDYAAAVDPSVTEADAGD